MTWSIWKYPLDGSLNQVIEIPEGGIFRSVAIQGNNITLWFEVNVNAPKERRQFCVFVTGWQTEGDPSGLTFLGTVFDYGFVWHVYEWKKEAKSIQ